MDSLEAKIDAVKQQMALVDEAIQHLQQEHISLLEDEMQMSSAVKALKEKIALLQKETQSSSVVKELEKKIALLKEGMLISLYVKKLQQFKELLDAFLKMKMSFLVKELKQLEEEKTAMVNKDMDNIDKIVDDAPKKYIESIPDIIPMIARLMNKSSHSKAVQSCRKTIEAENQQRFDQFRQEQEKIFQLKHDALMQQLRSKEAENQQRFDQFHQGQEKTFQLKQDALMQQLRSKETENQQRFDQFCQEQEKTFQLKQDALIQQLRSAEAELDLYKFVYHLTLIEHCKLKVGLGETSRLQLKEEQSQVVEAYKCSDIVSTSDGERFSLAENMTGDCVELVPDQKLVSVSSSGSSPAHQDTTLRLQSS